MCKIRILSLALVVTVSAAVSASQRIDLSNAKVVVLNPQKKIETNAADMLRDEIDKRTRIELDVVSKMPDTDEVAIVIGTVEELAKKSCRPVAGLEVPSKPDAYAVWIDTSKRQAPTICAAGHDDRGTLFAVGRLLRLLEMSRDKVGLDGGIRLATAPRYSLRGHQFGYRPKTNSYDAWTIKMWEQYYRDMVVFGMNALELIPPRSDDADDSPHFPISQMEMMVKMSQLADDYGLDVWIWYPAIDDDYSDPKTVEFALKERDEVFKKLPRIDALFVPGGDPGDTHPKILLPFMKQQKKLLNRYHPKATIWVSPQGFDRRGKNRDRWLRAFFDILQTQEPKWLDGVVFGPQVETSLANLRKEVPGRYRIRRYPDITHSRSSQYAVPDWDDAYRGTLGREPINPRPRGYAKIFRDLQQHSFGFITYSEGCNDDVNKIIWSCLGWDPEMKVEDILRQYSRYFISARYEQKFAEGLLALERNWIGPLKDNEGVYETLELFQDMERNATPQELLNWRFQQGLYRAYYDAYVRHRLIYETELEQQAMELLKTAEKTGSPEAADKAEAILDKAVTKPVATDLRARVFELAEALFQSIRMQLSVEKYQAIRVNRGANLDEIDKPLNRRRELKKRIDAIRKLALPQAKQFKHGLAGTYFNSEDFLRPEEGIDILTSVDNDWGDDRGNDWTARWTGFIEGPFSGQVAFTADVNDGLRLKIGDTIVIDGLSETGARSGKIVMAKGKKYPVILEFMSLHGEAKLHLYWQWQGQAKTIVPNTALSYDASKLPKNARLFDYESRASKDDDDDDDETTGPEYKQGLMGTYFNGREFTEPDMSIDFLKHVQQEWQKDRGNDWSAKWYGFIEGPATGQVKFFVDVKDSFQLNIDGESVIEGLDESGARQGEFIMEKGKKYPVEILYISLHGQAKLHLYWQWAGQQKTIVAPQALSHDAGKLPKNYRVFDYDNRLSEGEQEVEGFVAQLPAFTGGSPPYANTDYLDGQLRPAVGAHNFEAIRCNRTHPELVTEKVPYYPDAGFENIGFTYNHQPTICYWHNKFWVIYESGPVHEHQPPCYALITWSEDGRNWHKPQTIFPAEKFRNKKEDNKLQYSLSHQRMNWYVSPDGRLIACGFHGMPDTPNDGKGIGRVVREIKGPGNYGPIYWVRYNEYQGYSKDDSPHYLYYKEAPDKGFVKAIDGLLANKLMVQQWYEEDQDTSEGFFCYVPSRTRYGKAFDWYTLPDGKIVGMWKWKKMVVANKWEPAQISQQGQGKDIYYGGAKIWGQHLSDGKYALVYNPIKNTTWRHPLSVTTSDDGMNFDTYFLNVHSETPLMRFGGANKDGGGAQYVRGIIPGNGTPPDGALWLTYSENKEDIRVTRVPVPIKGTVDKDAEDSFDDMTVGGIVTDWNVYCGIWTPISVVKDNGNKFLRLADKDPYDYAKAVRVFPETTKAQISFELRPQQIGRDDLEIEIQNYKGQRPVRIIIDGKNAKIKANKGESMNDVASFTAGKWLKLGVDVDTTVGKYDLKLDGKNVVSGAAFAETLDNSNNPYKSKFAAPTVERIVFRTGTWRMKDFSRYGFGANDYRKNEPDLPGSDEAVDNAVFDIDYFRTASLKRYSAE